MLLTIFNNMLVALTMHIYNSTVFSVKENCKIRLIFCWGIATLVFSSQAIWGNSFALYNLITSVIPYLLISIFFYKATIRRTIFFVFLYYIFAMLIDAFTYFLLKCFCSVELLPSIIANEKFTLAYNIFVWLIIRFFSMLVSKERYEIELIEWLETVFVPIGSIFLVMWCFGYKKSIDSFLDILGLFIIMLFNVISYITYIRMQERVKLEYKAGLLNNQNQCYLEETKRITYLWKKISEFEHDNKYLFEKLIANNQSIIFTNKVANSGNFVIDSIINNRAMVTENDHIYFDVNLKIPYDMELCQNDISILLCNLLDNAIEANYWIEDTRWIKIDIKSDVRNNETLFITISNPYQNSLKKNDTGEYITNKKDSLYHGIGLQSVRNIVDKHLGNMKITEENNEFKVEIILFNMANDEKYKIG